MTQVRPRGRSWFWKGHWIPPGNHWRALSTTPGPAPALGARVGPLAFSTLYKEVRVPREDGGKG